VKKLKKCMCVGDDNEEEMINDIGLTMMNVNRGAEYDVWQELVKISGVTRVVHVFGEFDYIAIIEAKPS
jgi:hypothetical protein